MSDQLKISGVILKVEDAVQVTEKMSKRNLVLTVGDKYPETVAVEFVNDKADLLDGLAAGQDVVAYFNVRGREYNGRYYTNLSGWRVEAAGAAPASQPANHNPALRAAAAPIASADDIELPF